MAYGYWVVYNENSEERTYTEIQYCLNKHDLLEFINQEKFKPRSDADPYHNPVYEIVKVFEGRSIQLKEKEVKIVKEYELGD